MRKFTKYPSNYVRADIDMDDASAVRIVCGDKAKYPRTLTTQVMTRLLASEDITTYKMFEELGAQYLYANESVRKGMDIACTILTYKNVPEIASEIIGEAAGETPPNAFGRFD